MKKGFTLVEILIAVTILGGISVVLSQAFFSISRAGTKTELVKDIKQSGDFAVRIIEEMIRSNTGIPVATCTSSGTPSTQLTINNPDGYSTTFGCVLDGSITRLASSSGGINSYLTPTNVSLGGTSCTDAAMSLSFFCTSFASQPDSVKVSFTLSQAGVPNDRFERASVPFQTTINARN